MSSKKSNYSPLEFGANWQICYKAGYVLPLENSTKASPAKRQSNIRLILGK